MNPILITSGSGEPHAAKISVMPASSPDTIANLFLIFFSSDELELALYYCILAYLQCRAHFFSLVYRLLFDYPASSLCDSGV
jgi:hypothetical protein